MNFQEILDNSLNFNKIVLVLTNEVNLYFIFNLFKNVYLNNLQNICRF